jgi:flagellar hook-basal body complex protein FliE
MTIPSISIGAPPAVSMLESPASLSTGGAVPGAGDANSFQAVFAEAIDRVQAYQDTSQATIGQFLDGADIDLHQVALNVQKAETAFELFAEVRNKVVQAYQEIMRLQV